MTKGISCRLYFSVLHTDFLLRNFNGCFNDFCIVNSPNVNSLFYSFAESPSAGTWGETLKAFVFSLKNSEDLPPFKCFAKNQYRTVYKSSSYGPKFGKLEIAYRYSNKRVEARAFLYKPYGVPAEVKNSYNDLVGTAKPFSPDNYEVFFLTGKSILDKNKQRIKEKMSNDMHFAGLRPKQCLRSRGSQWFLYCCLLIT